MSTGDDSGGIVVGWLVKLVAVFSVVGVVGFDGISMAVAELGVTDSAVLAARAASQELALTGNGQLAHGAAVQAATEASVDNVVPHDGIVVTADGAVSVTVVRYPPTLVLHHVPGSEDWLVAESTSSVPSG